MCRRWNTSWREPGVIQRLLLALALLLAPLGAWQAAPAATMPVCNAEGGVRLVPFDPAAPALSPHAHCDACLVAPPALPAPPAVLQPPRAGSLAWAGNAARTAAPLALPPEQARAPPGA
jgi:hypothetical protein